MTPTLTLCSCCLQRPTVGEICQSCGGVKGHIGQCCLCYEPISFDRSKPTVFDLRICDRCYHTLYPKPYRFTRSKFLKTGAERKHEAYYKAFLEGKRYPEIKCYHKSSDGSETFNPIESRKFFTSTATLQ